MAGENGAGKSTLGKLMVRLYDPVRGSIRLGGEDIRNIRLESLRRHICYLPREPVLFDGTLASNLRLARPSASENDLDEAIRNVGLSSFVRTLPDGLRQRIGPGGCQLSGGQRQRLATGEGPFAAASGAHSGRSDVLSRRSWRNTSSREYLAPSPGSTLVVVSHRLSTFSHFEEFSFFRPGGSSTIAVPDVLMRAQNASAHLLLPIPPIPANSAL